MGVPLPGVVVKAGLGSGIPRGAINGAWHPPRNYCPTCPWVGWGISLPPCTAAKGEGLGGSRSSPKQVEEMSSVCEMHLAQGFPALGKRALGVQLGDTGFE